MMTITRTNTTPLISKSKFLWGLQCDKLLWHAFHGKHLIANADASPEAAFEQGREVGALARRLFPDGIDVADGINAADDAVKLTTKALLMRVPLFEAAFAANGGYCLVDILLPSSNEAWDIIEIKSTTAVKDVHLDDLAFQQFVLSSAGLKIRHCKIGHINTEFVRNGPIDPRQFFCFEDVTGEILARKSRIAGNLDNMFTLLRLQESPDTKVGGHCASPYRCPLYDHCWGFLPEQNVMMLYRGGGKGFTLLENGITDLKHIPDDFPLTNNQDIQRRTAISGQPHADKAAIEEFLAELIYPISYLDFETLSTAIPLFDGVRPYRQIPFQYSLHIVPSPGAEPEHRQFLAEGTADPRLEFIRQLKDALPASGSVVAYNATFELSRLRECADLEPGLKKWVDEMENRIIDLLVPFRQFRYYHPAQSGSASMKSVLPALTGKGYDHLEIQDGVTASLEFLRATFGSISADECAAVRQHLHEYCGLDTLGMIWITDALRRLA